MKANLIKSINAKPEFGTNLLQYPASEYEPAEFEIDFSALCSLDAIADRLRWLDSRGYHLINDRDWAFSSEALAKVIDMMIAKRDRGDLVTVYELQYLTRTGNLRMTVAGILREANVA